jgi:hypothetical protein
VSAALTAIVAFNLICTGTATTGISVGAELTKQKSEPFEIVYRVDLSSRTWCAGACGTRKPVAKATDDDLLLEQNDDGAEVYTSMNRDDGSYIHRLKAADFVLIELGSCARAEFTGFPPRKF